MDLYSDADRQYADFAVWARGESPCFEEWALGVAGDDEVLSRLRTLPPVKQQPNLVFAAARWHGVGAPEPYEALRERLLTDWPAVRTTILQRSTQTNEVGRLATLLPAFAELQQRSGKSLALLEVGASAGLCLYPDRYAYAWSTEAGLRTAAPGTSGGATLTCVVSGPAPLPASPPPVGWRAGIDLNPLDVRDDDAMAWLQNLVWPEQQDRRDRLRRAVEVARREPPALVRGDLISSLPGLIRRVPGDMTLVVFHSAVVAYLTPEDRVRFQRLMTGLVADGSCHWVSNESPQVLPEIAASDDGPPSERPTFLLGIDGRAVARTHGHGATMTWLDDVAG